MDGLSPEARAITNFIGNPVATLIVAKWDRECDATKAREILAGPPAAVAETGTGTELDTPTAP